MANAEPTSVPAGYLDVAGLDDVTWQELTERREWLLTAIGSVGPGARHSGIPAAALALVAVITELDTRAKMYANAADHQYTC